MGRKIKSREQGFTRADILAVVFVTAVLATTQFAAIANHRQTSQSAICLNNLSQLQQAWQGFVDDANGSLPASSASGGASTPEWIGSPSGNPDALNVSMTNSPLWQYSAKNLDHWRCPSDPARVITGNPQQTYRRVRTYSMNIYMQNYSIFSVSPYSWITFRSIHDFNALAPKDALLLIDEHSGSVNEAAFTMDMTGYPAEPDKWKIIDTPGSNHAGGAGVLFVDGHVELKRWEDQRTKPPYVAGKYPSMNVVQAGNPDIFWIQERSTRKIAP